MVQLAMREVTKLEYIERRSMQLFNQRYQFFRELDEEVLTVRWTSWDSGYSRFKGMVVQFIVLKITKGGVQADRELSMEFKGVLVEKLQTRAALEVPGTNHQQLLNMLATQVIDELWEDHGNFGNQEINKLVWKS